jgi:predicted PurR-regulated permease PerM
MKLPWYITKGQTEVENGKLVFTFELKKVFILYCLIKYFIMKVLYRILAIIIVLITVCTCIVPCIFYWIGTGKDLFSKIMNYLIYKYENIQSNKD